ncbi:hypothetical protein J6590_025840 [Homalodisca vitripennis]|nr:hypothetical protein J6590_025840 [Homalodisca vitripennis]
MLHLNTNATILEIECKSHSQRRTDVTVWNTARDKVRQAHKEWFVVLNIYLIMNLLLRSRFTQLKLQKMALGVAAFRQFITSCWHGEDTTNLSLDMTADIAVMSARSIVCHASPFQNSEWLLDLPKVAKKDSSASMSRNLCRKTQLFIAIESLARCLALKLQQCLFGALLQS